MTMHCIRACAMGHHSGCAELGVKRNAPHDAKDARLIPILFELVSASGIRNPITICLREIAQLLEPGSHVFVVRIYNWFVCIRHGRGKNLGLPICGLFDCARLGSV